MASMACLLGGRPPEVCLTLLAVLCRGLGLPDDLDIPASMEWSFSEDSNKAQQVSLSTPACTFQVQAAKQLLSTWCSPPALPGPCCCCQALQSGLTAWHEHLSLHTLQHDSASLEDTIKAYQPEQPVPESQGAAGQFWRHLHQQARAGECSKLQQSCACRVVLLPVQQLSPCSHGSQHCHS